MPVPNSALSKRACDACRQRKVKCDATQPCANCSISNLDCTFKVIPRKRGPKTPRAKAQDPPPNRQRTSRSPQTRSGDNGRPQVTSTTHCEPVGTATSVYSMIDSATPPSRIRGELFSAIFELLPSPTIRQVVDECISLYVLHMFPVCPICHVPTLRTMAAAYFPVPGSASYVDDTVLDEGAEKERVAAMRPFTLLTALCAAVASIYPDSILAYRDLVATPFLQASRRIMKVYEDYDTQYPDSSSLAIRLFQSAALQHSAGKTPLAWHVLSQGGLLAQHLRLHDEHVLSKYDPLESTLLRNNFWMLYVCDKAAISLANRHVTLHEPLFDSTMTIKESDQTRVPLLDPSMRNVPDSFEDTLMVGFHLIQRCWASTGRLLLAVRSKRQNTTLTSSMAETTSATEKDVLTSMYIEVMSLLDDLPPWLNSPDTVDLDAQYDVAFQRSCFWTQKSRLIAMFHGVRIMVLRQCIEHGLMSLIGLNDDPLTLAMEQINIARDVVHSLTSVPFQYIQTNGEPGIELMRVVGSILLELSQNVENDVVRGRASSLLSSLLDILARLDSKASEELLSQQT
ncbi:hypothetical protein CGMCC3_g17251 [Colletotrichum fructicola]|nr:uncharacterized protein CGMCC3_g17251 [Colletotrichum fructicola]KAE9566576.1 hypothetical protein CGMCC3_g17251 [Colletotrichum fructicola]